MSSTLRRDRTDIASAMFPSLVKPEPPPNPYAMTEAEWRDKFFEMCGLRRKR
jgi:hypothetical protein